MRQRTIAVLHRRRPPRLVLLVAGVAAAAVACGGQLPNAPEVGLLTISGHVYQQGTAETGEPKLASVLITVQEDDGFSRTVISDEVGFYSVAVRAGTISITASKAGYATRVSTIDFSDSTVLNFSLIPS
jgi:hypothetical protein